MKSIAPSVIFAVLGFLGLGASGLQAAPSLANVNLRIALTAKMQAPTDSGPPSIQTVRITTKDLVSMLGAALTNDFTGAVLSVEGLEGTNVVLSGTRPGLGREDVTSYFTLAWGQDIWAGVNEFVSRRGHGVCMLTFGFNDGKGNSFTLTGLIREHTTWTSESWQMQAAGEGTLNGRFALFQGMIRGSRTWNWLGW